MLDLVDKIQLLNQDRTQAAWLLKPGQITPVLSLSSLVNKIDFSELKNRMVINSDCDITIEGYLRDTDLVQPTSVLKSRRSHGLANDLVVDERMSASSN